ncbi:MAG: hypothetical protein AB7I36_20500 [Rhodospirillaceae bacterium]
MATPRKFASGGQPKERVARTAQLSLGAFQREAYKTSQLTRGSSPQHMIAPILGLASETGSILDIYKKYLRDAIDLKANREFLKEELGDLLWYIATVATAYDLRLEAIARNNLVRTKDRYPKDTRKALAALPVFDRRCLGQERFPRKVTIAFTETRRSGKVIAELRLIAAQPNPFPKGQITILEDGEEKKIGFAIGMRLGDELTDNSRRADDYRYHDAVHLGFMAVLGWSPIMRSLLGVRRRSNPVVNESEDGARAKYAEEGLSAVLAALSVRRLGFSGEIAVDGDSIGVAKAVTANLEARHLPGWAWRRAISQGFSAMHALGENKGGYLLADVDKRTLTYKKSL